MLCPVHRSWLGLNCRFDGLPVVLLDKWEDLCTLDLRKTRDDLAKLLPVPERVFTTQHWYDRYRHKHTCKV